MTCIVGLVDRGRVFLGGDSASVNARYELDVRADRKVFRNGDFVMGFTTSFRMGQLLAHTLKPPKPEPKQDLMAFMTTGFVDAVRACLKAGGFASRTNETESGGDFLVGYGGRLFQVQSDYQVAESAYGFAACGCGDMIALGSLRSTRDWKDPAARLREALTTAEALCAGVRAPFAFETTAKPERKTRRGAGMA